MKNYHWKRKIAMELRKLLAKCMEYSLVRFRDVDDKEERSQIQGKG